MMTASKITSGATLTSLLEGLAAGPLPDISITGICLDSRKARPGDLFLAFAGVNTSGVEYIRHAITSGVVAVAVEQGTAENIFEKSIPVIPVKQLRENAGVIAARFYGNPSAAMNVIGITGTNGKTSVAWFVSRALASLRDNAAGSIGTLGTGTTNQITPGLNTTPDPVLLQKSLAEFVQQGVLDTVIEVTSIGLDQFRIAGTELDIAVFTNLSPDHLDYHKGMDDYGAAKKKLFTDFGASRAVINLDDPFGRQLALELRLITEVYGYSVLEATGLEGVEKGSNLYATVSEFEKGMTICITCPWGSGEVEVPICGRYNASNLLASLACLCLSGIPFTSAMTQLANLQPVPGRMEMFGGEKLPLIFVDYAHTPDALEKVLGVINQKQHKRVICVFGCGGDRDKPKRSLMGAVAKKLSDVLIITDDNPRNEEPENIINDIISGIHDLNDVLIINDRREAIRQAVHMASSGDVVLIAGKGHESYQERAGKRSPFSDQDEVRNILGELP